jgi:hypothetical protein
VIFVTNRCGERRFTDRGILGMTASEVHTETGISKSTLAYWRRASDHPGREPGPEWYRIGRRIYYPPDKFAEWVADRRKRNSRGGGAA